MKKKRNCKNCKHLEWYEAGCEEFGDSGAYCAKRDYYKYPNSEKAESIHLEQLQKDSYLELGKKCCEFND